MPLLQDIQALVEVGRTAGGSLNFSAVGFKDAVLLDERKGVYVYPVRPRNSLPDGFDDLWDSGFVSILYFLNHDQSLFIVFLDGKCRAEPGTQRSMTLRNG